MAAIEPMEVVPNDEVLHELIAGAVSEVQRGILPPTSRGLNSVVGHGLGQAPEVDSAVVERCPSLTELTMQVRSGSVRDSDFDAAVRGV